jgi:hypothetical protein
MTKKAYNKIAAGLMEALSVARGESEPARVRVVPLTKDLKRKIDDLVGDVRVDIDAPLDGVDEWILSGRD